MESIWSQTCPIKERPVLPGDTETEVAVIGAGMAGVLIASALRESGVRAIVLEADRIASGQTRNTTAKLTSQHGLIYGKLTQTRALRRRAVSRSKGWQSAFSGSRRRRPSSSRQSMAASYFSMGKSSAYTRMGTGRCTR